jgi:hypothetical protein
MVIPGTELQPLLVIDFQHDITHSSQVYEDTSHQEKKGATI